MEDCSRVGARSLCVQRSMSVPLARGSFWPRLTLRESIYAREEAGPLPPIGRQALTLRLEGSRGPTSSNRSSYAFMYFCPISVVLYTTFELGGTRSRLRRPLSTRYWRYSWSCRELRLHLNMMCVRRAPSRL